jgi:pimeloyl-ACP methyl ester carboxylesterase
MEHVLSKDGTSIAYARGGSGSPLILVHGAGADHTRWAPVLSGLEQFFTVYAVDRRGRGQSGDSDPYSVEREFEDLIAVIEAIDGSVNLLGHSYGGLCALGAALQTTRLRRLVLYEPPIPVSGTFRPQPTVLTKLQTLIAQGDRETAVVTFAREVAGASNAEIDLMRASPVAWAGRLAAIHTVLRELQVTSGDCAVDVSRLKTLPTPTLLLLGGDSAPHLHAGAATLQAILPNVSVAIMPGQQHLAMNTAPDLFTSEVVRFLTIAG